MFLFRPTLVGDELYTQMGFVQTILADRYNHRRELWVVSLESPSSVEYGTKKIFLVPYSTLDGLSNDTTQNSTMIISIAQSKASLEAIWS